MDNETKYVYAWDEVQRLQNLIATKDDALQSYAEFYSKAAGICGLPDDANPSTETDGIILIRLAEHDEIERLRAEILQFEAIQATDHSDMAAMQARVAELEASEARLEKGKAVYEELTSRLVERFSDRIAWSDVIEMQVEISRERK
jgi:primosomal protein N''